MYDLQARDSGKMIEKPVMKADSGTQTDTHFHESNIVASYEWNEWELRRKAIKLVSFMQPSLLTYCIPPIHLCLTFGHAM